MRGEFYQQLTNDLETARAEGLFKEERIITSAQQADITVADGSHVINFCANNYLKGGNGFSRFRHGFGAFYLRHSGQP